MIYKNAHVKQISIRERCRLSLVRRWRRFPAIVWLMCGAIEIGVLATFTPESVPAIEFHLKTSIPISRLPALSKGNGFHDGAVYLWDRAAIPAVQLSNTFSLYSPWQSDRIVIEYYDG